VVLAAQEEVSQLQSLLVADLQQEVQERLMEDPTPTSPSLERRIAPGPDLKENRRQTTRIGRDNPDDVPHNWNNQLCGYQKPGSDLRKRPLLTSGNGWATLRRSWPRTTRPLQRTLDTTKVATIGNPYTKQRRRRMDTTPATEK